MNIQQKEGVVASIAEQLRVTQAAFLVDYKGTSCADLSGVRKQLRRAGASFVVTKNTLVKRAIQDTKAEGLSSYLKGPTAVVWAEDPVEPAKILTEFAKDKDSFTVKGAYVDGSVVSAQDVEALAKMPSKAELQARLLALINAPATQLVRLMNTPATNLARLIDAWRAELEKRNG